MITKELEKEILANKIEITEDNIRSLIYEYDNAKDLFDIPDELIERTFNYDLLFSEDFYYISERGDIIDFTELQNLFMMFGNKAYIVFKKNDFVDVYVCTMLWTAKIKWFYPKETTNDN